MANYRLRQTGQEVQDLLDKVEGIEIENGTIKVGEESITPVTEETDPTVPAWAKEPTKPSYSLAELQEDATHRTVTDTEKATWNGKQDVIADLNDIRSGAGAGATAVQPSQMQTALAGKQDTLVSGQNIKTINGESILGGGDIEIESGDEAVWGNISGTLADQTDLANALGAKYEKPSTGIPEADLAAAAREKLDKADTALQSESDPVFGASPAAGIQSSDITAWNAKYAKPANGIPASDIADGVIPDVSQFVTATVNNLVNYYLKSETYTRDEIQALVAAIPGMLFVPVNTLPTASAETANKIYIVPATNPQSQNQMDEFYTKVDGSSYTWEYFGSASIDLSNYVTTTALNTALANYTTTENLTALLAGKQDTISDLATIRSGAAAGATAYQKPSGGIPKDDLASAVQTSLGKADTALQSFTETDPTVPAWAKASTKPSYTASEVGALPDTTVIPDQLSDLSDDATHRLVTDTEKANWNAKYSKPSGGIPASDLASGVIPSTYAGSPSAGGPANKALGIPFGYVDSTSTDTVMTATVDNFPTILTAGVCAYIRNDIIASASGWTLNINGTGALPVYSTLSDASRITTLFSAASTHLFVYNPTRVEGGCWDLFYGYNSDTNTIGYNLRTGAATPPTASKFYRYRILFTSQNGQSLIPANTSSSTNATAARAVNQAKIDPFGPIFYYSTTAAVDANASVGAAYAWLQYSGIALGYSFNRVGAALTMTAKDPVYIKCAPQTDGSAIMDADTPIVQALPSTEDGNIYIYLGIAESATAITLYYWHPIYWYKDGAIRQWTNAKEIVVDSVPTQGSTNPVSSGGVYAVLGDIETLLAAI